MREPQFPTAVRTAADFTIEQRVNVIADQGVREGVVTKVARTRIHVRHPRNKTGDMVERAYSMDSVVVGQMRESLHGGWIPVRASGEAGTWGQTKPYGSIPLFTPPKGT